MNRLYADEPLYESIGSPAEREAELRRRIAELEDLIKLKDALTIEANQDYDEMTLRAENAEAQLNAVRALPDKWRTKLETHYLGEDDFLHGRKDANHTCANELEKALQGEKE